MSKIKHSYEKSFKAGLPVRGNVDPLNPRQAFLPFFVGFIVKGAPLIADLVYYEELSEHLVECLGIPTEEKVVNGKKVRRLLEPIGESQGWEPRRKYIPPHTLLDKRAAAGKWVTMDEPEPSPESISDTLNRMVDANSRTAAEGIPAFVLVKDFRKALNLTHAQAKELLKGWGVPNATPQTKIDKGLAMRIVAHVNRLRNAHQDEETA